MNEPAEAAHKNNSAAKSQGGREKWRVIDEIYDWVEVFVISTAVVFLLFTFVFRIAQVIGPSMENTLHQDDMLIISDMFYRPKTGDVIVFQLNAEQYPDPLVKRVIATEGQTVDINFDTWTVTVDGVTLDESYVNYIQGVAMRGSSYSYPLEVPEGMVFVMGDNRNDSMDSRDSRIGLVDERYILGHVKLRIYPFNKFGTLD